MKNVIFSIAIAICAMMCVSCSNENIANENLCYQELPTTDSATISEQTAAFFGFAIWNPKI